MAASSGAVLLVGVPASARASRSAVYGYALVSMVRMVEAEKNGTGWLEAELAIGGRCCLGVGWTMSLTTSSPADGSLSNATCRLNGGFQRCGGGV